MRTIESCNQNLSMALVNQTLPFRTRRLGEYQQSRHRGGSGKRNGRMIASELPVVTEAWASRSGEGSRHRMLEGSADIWPYVSSRVPDGGLISNFCGNAAPSPATRRGASPPTTQAAGVGEATTALATAPCHGTARLLPDACYEAVSVFLKSPKVRFQQPKYSLGIQCVRARCS
jgi:hypothetical protein